MRCTTSLILYLVIVRMKVADDRRQLVKISSCKASNGAKPLSIMGLLGSTYNIHIQLDYLWWRRIFDNSRSANCLMSTPRYSEMQQGPYTIRKFAPNLYPFEHHLNLFKCFHSLTWSLWLFHIIFDVSFALQIRQDDSPGQWNLWIALMAEVFLTLPEALAALDIALGLFSGRANRPRPRYDVSGDVVPTVDVMITCCGEPVPIILNTIKAATAQKYPQQKFRVFVLDDGADRELRMAVESLVLDWEKRKFAGPVLRYLSRSKDPATTSFFKSGNLRFGIEASHRLDGGFEFLAGLDADMIVDPDWLRKMVPHLILNTRVACVCGPQVRYVMNGNIQSPQLQSIDNESRFYLLTS